MESEYGEAVTEAKRARRQHMAATEHWVSEYTTAGAYGWECSICGEKREIARSDFR